MKWLWLRYAKKHIIKQIDRMFEEIFQSISNFFQNLSIFEILCILFIIGLTVFIIYYNTGSGNSDYLTTMTPLNVKKEIVTSDIVTSTLLQSSSSTVIGFFNLQQGNRTTSYNNDYAPLLYIDNNWRLEISHAPNGEQTAARLSVQTNNATNTLNIEKFDLPQIPKQKWICIAILREGRRFDVMYDNRIVASQRLANYPVEISSPLAIGDPSITGKCIHVIINSKRLSPNEVDRIRRSYVDTNNMIIEDISLVSSLPTLKLTVNCPPGLPCDTITTPPTNKMLEWESPYA